MAELPRSFRSWLVVPSYHVLDEAELVTIVGLDTVSVGKPIQKLFDSSKVRISSSFPIHQIHSLVIQSPFLEDDVDLFLA
ncbi:MAG: hypothetical protein ACK56F_31655, partial [bacterium]